MEPRPIARTDFCISRPIPSIDCVIHRIGSRPQQDKDRESDSVRCVESHRIPSGRQELVLVVGSELVSEGSVLLSAATMLARRESQS